MAFQDERYLNGVNVRAFDICRKFLQSFLGDCVVSGSIDWLVRPMPFTFCIVVYLGALGAPAFPGRKLQKQKPVAMVLSFNSEVPESFLSVLP
jgi:hypothetical protein